MALLAALVVFDGAAVTAQTGAHKTTIGAPQDEALLSIVGTVTHSFGNRFVLEHDSGPLLVDTGPHWFAKRAFAVGERLRVRGRIDGMDFEAREIVRTDGSTVVIRPDRGPPPWAGGPRRRGTAEERK
jgi:hypothetical protein